MWCRVLAIEAAAPIYTTCVGALPSKVKAQDVDVLDLTTRTIASVSADNFLSADGMRDMTGGSLRDRWLLGSESEASALPRGMEALETSSMCSGGG